MIYKNRRISIICAIILIILLVYVDQVTKSLAVSHLMGKDDLILINGVLQLHYLENIGAAFSTLSGQRMFFLILTPILVLCIVYIYLNMPLNKKYTWLYYICIFLISGAVGNYIDRFRLSYVVDMIYFSLIDFPVFNVADIYVTCSVTVLIILILFYYKDNDIDEITKSLKIGKTHG